MKYSFEVYLISDAVSVDNWKKLYAALLAYLGPFSNFEVLFSCENNTVRYFLRSNRDISTLSNGIEGILIRPVDEAEAKSPEVDSKERMLRLVTGGNILDLKEKISVKRSKELERAVFRVRAINIEKAIVRGKLFFKAPGNQWSKASKLMTVFPSQLLAIDFTTNTRYLKKTIPKYLNIEKSLHMMTSHDDDALFEVDTFPYLANNYYLGLTDYEFDKHSFIIGASGSGKSKFISLFVDRLSQTQLKMNYRVVVIDPHAAIADDFRHIPDTKVVAFNKNDSTDLFPGAETDLTSATELTATLFKSVLGDQFTARLDKLLRFSLFTLMTAQAMSLEHLRKFLSDIDYRSQILAHVHGFIPDNVEKFFGADFNEFRTKYYNETILPIVSMVDEMQLQPSLVNESEVSLARTIQENFLTVFSLNKVSMGEKVVKTIAGLLIQQIFLLAQARSFGEKVILIIDEVSVVQNPALSQILAEARKFNLTVILTQQYFGQVEKDLRDAIFANVFNYYTFKVSEEDARALEGNLNIEIPKEIAESEREKGVSESTIKVKIMTELNPRDCLVRVVSNGQVAPCFKARTMDAPEPVHVMNKELKPYHALPSKFVEHNEVTKPKVAGNEENGEVTEMVPAQVRFTSIKDLLAAHSASRQKVNKKKDTL